MASSAKVVRPKTRSVSGRAAAVELPTPKTSAPRRGQRTGRSHNAAFARSREAKGPALQSVAVDASARILTPLECHTALESDAFYALDGAGRGVVAHNAEIAGLMRARYAAKDVKALREALDRLGTLDIKALPSGLPRAASLSKGSKAEETGYDAVWTRDAVKVIRQWRLTGQTEKAARGLKALLAYYATPEQTARLVQGVHCGSAGTPEAREWARAHPPHIKFDGEKLTDLATPWNHKQWDALGLLLSEAFEQQRSGVTQLDDRQLATTGLVAGYLRAIDFSTAIEVGHWEEAGEKGGKISASTLACVLAGLEDMREWVDSSGENRRRLQQVFDKQVDAHARTYMLFPLTLAGMIAQGRAAFRALMATPCESKGSGVYNRPCDLALTTVLELELSRDHGRQLIPEELQLKLLENIKSLRRSHGDIRYPRDGYYAAWLEADPEAVTQMNLATLEARAKKKMKENGEAQWTLGAPIVSAIWGKLYLETGNPEYLENQTLELNRALGMITGDKSTLGPGMLPESYFQVRYSDLDHPGQERWTFIDNGLPLNWSKANLALAIRAMEESVKRRPSKKSGVELWH